MALFRKARDEKEEPKTIARQVPPKEAKRPMEKNIHTGGAKSALGLRISDFTTCATHLLRN